jgi:predicted MPP superfamily phosphohydrolase
MSSTRILTATMVLAGLTLLLHRYLWVRLIRDPQWPILWERSLTVGVLVLAVAVPLTFLAVRWLPRAANAPLAWLAYTWLGFALYLFLLGVIADAGRGLTALFGLLPRDAERRLFLTRTIAASVGAVSALVGLGGVVNVVRGFDVRHVRIPIARLPKHGSGYTIVQLTDMHVGPTIGRAFVEDVVRETNALVPDMVVITGDLVDGSVEQLRDLVAPLRDLRAADGVFFVTGNHEYYSGVDVWIAHLRTLGIRILRNERVLIRELFDLAGVDDARARGMAPGHGQDVPRALAGRDASRPVVLLAHQPRALKDSVPAGVDLQLSGHVHGGQMVPFNWLARLDQPVIAGLHRIEKTWVYVSTGTGYWGPPMRVGPRAEVTRIELVAA